MHPVASGGIALVAGAVGALLVVRLLPPSAPTPVAEAAVAKPAAPALRPPDSWNPLFMARLSAVEGRLGELESPRQVVAQEARAPSEPIAADEEADARRRDREQVYQQQLENLATAQREHRNEPIDEAWAEAQKGELETAFAAVSVPEHPFRVSEISCRSKTCFVTTTFDSASDALAANHSITDVAISGCRGMITTLEPPKQPGPYDVRILYNNCR